MRCPRELCLMGSTTWTRPRRLALEPRCIGVAPSRPKLRTNFVTRGPNTSLTSCRSQTFTPCLSALPMSSAGGSSARADLNGGDEVAKACDIPQASADGLKGCVLVSHGSLAASRTRRPPAKTPLNVLDSISKAGAKFKSLADAWADTTTPHGELMITILAGLATFERHLIKARTDEGRKRAQARGVKFGRPTKLSRCQIEEALARREAGEALVEIG